MASPQHVSVNIRRLAVGGAGVGEVIAESDGETSLLGITAFVPFTAVGERVLARVVEKKDRYLKAELIEIESPGADRVQAPCPHYQTCGGCELQHLSYAGELAAKHDMILGALKAGKLSSQALSRVLPMVSGAEYGYRRRVSLHIDAGGRVGFYRANSRSVVPIERCLIAVPEINEVLPAVKELGHVLQGKVSSLLLEADGKGLIAVLKSPYDLTTAEQKTILDCARSHFENVSLMVGEREVGGFGRQILELPLNAAGTLMLSVPAGSFSQVNWGINLKLLHEVIQRAGVPAGTPVYDLYAGAGNFALPLARAGMKVTAVECDKRLVNLGRENARRYALESRLNYVESSVEKFFAKKHPKGETGLAIADPPRSGLGQLVSSFQFTKRVHLISCHLPSFVRDLKAFVELGWEVEAIIPFDMFSQTSYVEILAVIHR